MTPLARRWYTSPMDDSPIIPDWSDEIPEDDEAEPLDADVTHGATEAEVAAALAAEEAERDAR